MKKVLLPLLIVLSAIVVIAQDAKLAKIQYKEGERLFKLGQVMDAYESFKLAAAYAPDDTKKQKKAREVGILAAVEAVKQGKEALSANEPERELKLLNFAVEADPQNAGARSALADANQRLDAARLELATAKKGLDGGDLAGARQALARLKVYSSLLQEYRDLDREIEVASLIDNARASWSQADAAGAIRVLSDAEAQAPTSAYVMENSRRLRAEIGQGLMRAATGMPQSTLIETLAKEKRVADILEADPGNSAAESLKKQLGAIAVEQFGAAPTTGFVVDKRPRIQLDRLLWLRSRLHVSNEKLDAQIAALQKRLYPLVTFTASAGTPADCPTSMTHDYLVGLVNEALKGLASEDNQKALLRISIQDAACTTADVPRERTEEVNSTYIVGYNQVVNPQYVVAEQELRAAQIEASRAEINNSINPSIVGAVLSGMAQGKVNRIRQAMQEIPPFLQQPVVQQYKYQKFQAYRAAKVEANLVLTASAGARQYTDERKVSFVAEHRDTGTTGVLGNDQNGARNTDPVLPDADSILSELSEGAKGEFQNGVRDVVAGYYATLAMDKRATDEDRIEAALFLSDLSAGTTYRDSISNYSEKLHASYDKGEFSPHAMVAGLNLPLSEHSQFADQSSAAAASPEAVIAGALVGVVSVETDKGSGSGFYVNASCAVVTNAHVVDGASTLIVRNSAKRIASAEVIAIDDRRDLALLKTTTAGCKPLPLGVSAKARVGQDVYAIGSPLGLTGTVTKGIVSNVRSLPNGVQYIQLDASLNPGNSGGPLINASGVVVGVNTFKVKGFENLNFAVSSDELKKAFSVLLAR